MYKCRNIWGQLFHFKNSREFVWDTDENCNALGM